ncbi:sialic acid TRAP transporter substrate-binding protein SiaP [Endozoicomonas ascidiicola]|uniref:sialic acid TRAP transporter substrate-binding protein SiaP n=1 Tax=Endozoicomonas ascidiicola TaxID=1698521 RepID=UPI00082A3583|nr:sialic acid TRAP transporter substrate-binding protein SiaP [Endozoicomonas ascidiicola]
MKNRLLTFGLAAAVSMGASIGQAAESVTLKFGLQQPVGSLEYTAVTKMSEALKTLSGGTMNMEVFPGGQLGDDRAMLSQVSFSELDMTYAQFERFGLWEPQAQVVSLPYAITDYDHLLRVINSEWGQSVQASLKDNHNWRIVDTWYLGTRQTTTNRPIESIEDFKGRKIRVPNAKSNLDFVKYSGGSPVPMAFSEVYLALQTNSVDGQENPLPIINQNKFYEVQNYLALTNHILNDHSVVMSNDRWNGLNEEQKGWLDAALKEGGKYHTGQAIAAETEMLEFFESQGMKITKPDITPFRTAMVEMYSEFEDKVKKPGLVKELQAL